MPLLESLARGFGRCLGGAGTVRQPRRLGRQEFLGLIDVGTVELRETVDLIQRDIGKQAQEAHDVRVLRVAPELPVFVSRQPVGREPDGAPRGLTHLGATGRRDERGREAEDLHAARLRPPLVRALGPAHQLHPAHDVAPLVRATHLEPHAMPAVQLTEVEALQDHVIELEKSERLLPFQAKPHAVERQHPTDGEMTADVAQQADVAERVQPIGIVRHDGIGRAVPEPHERLDAAADARHVGRDRGVIQHLPCFVLAGGVTDPGRATAH